MRTTQSDLDSQFNQNRESSQGYAADQRVRSSLTIRLEKGCTHWPQEEDMGQEYMSLHLSLKLTTNSVPL